MPNDTRQKRVRVGVKTKFSLPLAPQAQAACAKPHLNVFTHSRGLDWLMQSPTQDFQSGSLPAAPSWCQLLYPLQNLVTKQQLPPLTSLSLWGLLSEWILGWLQSEGRGRAEEWGLETACQDVSRRGDVPVGPPSAPKSLCKSQLGQEVLMAGPPQSGRKRKRAPEGKL